MRHKEFLSILLFLAIALSGCSSVATRNKAALSKAVYATQKALTVGRVDLAKAYNAQAVRLLPPPRKAAVVGAVEKTGKRYVVLPVEYSGQPTLFIGSSAMDALIAGEKPLQRQLAAEKTALGRAERETDKVITEKEKLVEKAEANALISRHTLWGKVRFYGQIALYLGALVAACFFFPALIPILISLGEIIFSLFGRVISFLISIFRK